MARLFCSRHQPSRTNRLIDIILVCLLGSGCEPVRDDAAVASFPLLICDCAGISVSPLVVSARQWPDGSPHSWHRQLIELSLLPRTSASCIHHSVHYRVCPLSIVAASSRSKSDTFSHNHTGILILSWSRSSSFATTSVASLRYVCLHEYVHAYVITIRSKQERSARWLCGTASRLTTLTCRVY